MWQEFQGSLPKVASVIPAMESEPSTGTSTDTIGSSPPQVLRTPWQHVADYTRLMMETVVDLTMGEDRAAPLITEVCSSTLTS